MQDLEARGRRDVEQEPEGEEKEGVGEGGGGGAGMRWGISGGRRRGRSRRSWVRSKRSRMGRRRRRSRTWRRAP